MGFSVLLMAAVSLVGAASSSASVAPPVPPPPVVSSSSSRGLASWVPGEVRCEAGVVVPGTALLRPLDTLAWPGAGQQQRPSLTVTFDIDAGGRPISIGEIRFTNDDVGPSLAASRFPAVARQGCSVTYTSTIEPIASADVAALMAYSISPISGALPREGWARIRPDGDCRDRPEPQPLLRAYPDFGKINGMPGVKGWAVIGYDTDARGRPVKVKAIAGNGNAALAAASVEAVRKSRFAGGARTGCSYRYWQEPEKVAAPAMPAIGTFQAEGACAGGGRQEWAKPPKLRFPPAYARRHIEGWAILSYDTAPWGAIGNVKVLAAQPAQDFGRQAMQILQSATVLPSPQGATGCVDRVKFVMNPKDADDDDADEPLILR